MGMPCFMDYYQHLVQNGSNNFFFFRVNEGQLTLLNFPKEARTRKKLRFIYTLNMSTRAGLMTKLLLKDRTLLCCVESEKCEL